MKGFKGMRGEDEQETLQEKNKGIVMFILLFAIVVGVALFAFIKSKNIDINNLNINSLISGNLWENKVESSKLLSEMKFDPNMNCVYTVIDGRIMECSKFAIRFLNEKGKELYTIQISMNTPEIKSEGNYTVVFDRGGKEIYAFKNSEKLWSKTLDENILNVDISKSGYVAVVHEETRYKSGVSIFNLQGMRIFKVGKAENYVLSAKISPSGNIVAFNNVDTNGIDITSIFEFSDIYGKLLEGTWSKEGEIFASSWFLDDESLALVGESSVSLIDKNQKEKWNKNIPGKIFSASNFQNEYLVLALSRNEENGIFNNSKTDIEIIDRDGDVEKIRMIDDGIKSLRTYGRYIAAISVKDVYFINKSGSIESQYRAPEEVSDVVFFDSGEALVVGRTSVYRVKYN